MVFYIWPISETVPNLKSARQFEEILLDHNIVTLVYFSEKPAKLWTITQKNLFFTLVP